LKISFNENFNGINKTASIININGVVGIKLIRELNVKPPLYKRDKVKGKLIYITPTAKNIIVIKTK
jgi:hypothetical protein